MAMDSHNERSHHVNPLGHRIYLVDGDVKRVLLVVSKGHVTKHPYRTRKNINQSALQMELRIPSTLCEWGTKFTYVIILHVSKQ